MRAAASLCLAAACLGLASCSLFGKKSSTQPAAPAGTGNNPARSAPGSQAERNVPPEVNGVLAGRVIDSYDHAPPPTFIQVVAAGENGNKGPPTEVEVDAQGYFTIQRLHPGQHYELIARTRDGQPRLAGRTWATPPNARVLIFMSSDFATGSTPPAPGAPAIPGQRNRAGNGQPAPQFPEKSGENGTGEGQRDPSKTSSINGPGARGAEIGTPTRIDDADASPPVRPNQPRRDIRPQDTARGSDDLTRNDAPLTNIPSATTGRETAPEAAEPAGIPAAATRVPSCVLTGRQLENFALYDLTGQPWEYRRHRGKLVLLDFWGTWCVPCRNAIPHLRILQETYGRAGLEVIGIAYESGTFPEQVRRVEGVAERLHINYKLLLGVDSEISPCPVRTQFGVRNFPTLFLLDENNRIIWHAEGLDEERLQDLTMLIKQKLRAR